MGDRPVRGTEFRNRHGHYTDTTLPLLALHLPFEVLPGEDVGGVGDVLPRLHASGWQAEAEAGRGVRVRVRRQPQSTPITPSPVWLGRRLFPKAGSLDSV